MSTQREDFKKYCLRNIGFTGTINIEDEQIEDRVDEAIKFFQEFHVDGSEQVFYKQQITNTEITNKYVVLPNNIVSVTKIFNLQDNMSTNFQLFDIKYQLTLNALFDFSSASFLNYYVTLQHLQALNILFNGELPFTFSPNDHKLYVYTGFGNTKQFNLGSYIVIECYIKFDPEVDTSIYQNRWLRKYCSALLKKNWAENLGKYDNVQMLGGVISSQKLYNQAQNDIDKLEQECYNNYRAPLNFLQG